MTYIHMHRGLRLKEKLCCRFRNKKKSILIIETHNFALTLVGKTDSAIFPVFVEISKNTGFLESTPALPNIQILNPLVSSVRCLSVTQ